MILITGAGGKTGKVLIEAFSTSESVCAFVFHPEHAAVVHALGAERVILGDLHDPAAIRSALDGVRAVYHIPPNMSPDETIIAELMLSEARKAGVEHFVYHSVLHPQTEKMVHHWEKLRAEDMIFGSGLSFTILQPAPYMQNFLAGWTSIIAEGLLRVPYSVHTRFSFIDLEDVAEAAKRVLRGYDHLHATYELAGTQPLSHAEVARIFSHALGRDVRAEAESVEAWKRRATGMSQYATEALAKMFAYYDQWGLAGNPNVLTWLLEREPASIESFLRKTLSRWEREHGKR